MFSIVAAVVIFLLTWALVTGTLWLVTAHLRDNEKFSITVKSGLNFEIVFLKMHLVNIW